MVDQLEQQGIVAKANEIGILPRFAAPCMLAKKGAARKMSPDQYEKLSFSDKLDHNRFVLAHNRLNEFLEKIPAKKLNTVSDTISMVGAHRYIITTDLASSFLQRHIKPHMLPYMAFHSPFKGTYIFKRSSMGVINQTKGIENMMTCILSQFIEEGWCKVHVENIYVCAHTQRVCVDRWDKVLQELSKNNIKLSAKKTFVFPEELDLLGWSKKGQFLIPDPHRQNVLATAELPRTVKQLRSYLGTYEMFYKCKENINQILKELQSM